MRMFLLKQYQMDILLQKIFILLFCNWLPQFTTHSQSYENLVGYKWIKQLLFQFLMAEQFWPILGNFDQFQQQSLSFWLYLTSEWYLLPCSKNRHSRNSTHLYSTENFWDDYQCTVSDSISYSRVNKCSLLASTALTTSRFSAFWIELIYALRVASYCWGNFRHKLTEGGCLTKSCND